MRIYALSDIHVDEPPNREWLQSLPRCEYADDILLLAGDVTHRLDLLAWALEFLRCRFREVFYVPGNHDLWVTQEDSFDSQEKFHRVIEQCNALDVRTGWKQLICGSDKINIVPLLSWYSRRGESEDTLYAPRVDACLDLSVWSDTYLIRWPSRVPNAMCDYFLDLNEKRNPLSFDGDVITFSHFLPRRELMLRAPNEPVTGGDTARFNFSEVAGCKRIDRQLRKLAATIHVYGHQHRNRVRTIEGVTYKSCCLGYSRERQKGLVNIEGGLPSEVWPGSPQQFPKNE